MPRFQKLTKIWPQVPLGYEISIPSVIHSIPNMCRSRRAAGKTLGCPRGRVNAQGIPAWDAGTGPISRQILGDFIMVLSKGKVPTL